MTRVSSLECAYTTSLSGKNSPVRGALLHFETLDRESGAKLDSTQPAPTSLMAGCRNDVEPQNDSVRLHSQRGPKQIIACFDSTAGFERSFSSVAGTREACVEASIAG